MRVILFVLLTSSLCSAELFISKDTMIQTNRGTLSNLHILSTTADQQVSIIKGYYGQDGNSALQYATDTIIVQKGNMALPENSYPATTWHKANDSTWQKYYNFGSTGVRYSGTFVKFDSFCIYTSNFIDKDTINAWNFFEIYSHEALNIGRLYLLRSLPLTMVNFMVKHPDAISSIKSKRYLVNGRSLGEGNFNQAKGIYFMKTSSKIRVFVK